MDEPALATAVTRLERAIARLERASHAPRPAPASATADAALARLEERHARLRTQVAETIGRLDTLIGDA